MISRPSDLFEFKRGEVLVCDAIDPGMTFALELKMVFKNRLSAGVESVITITETGHRLISQAPVEVFVC